MLDQQFFNDMSKNNILLSIDNYESFEQYEEYNNYTKEDFSEELESGYIQDATMYYGISGNLKPVKLTDDNIINSLIQYSHEIDFANNYQYSYYFTEKTTDLSIVEYMTEFFKVFTLDGKIYVSDR